MGRGLFLRLSEGHNRVRPLHEPQVGQFTQFSQVANFADLERLMELAGVLRRNTRQGFDGSLGDLLEGFVAILRENRDHPQAVVPLPTPSSKNR